MAGPSISVITATYNSMVTLPDLVASLRAQTDHDFEWVIADGQSTDGTVEYLKSLDGLDIKLISQKDFGVYDALNRAIMHSCGAFYLVVGSDDVLYPGAIRNYSKSIGDGRECCDLVFAKCEVNGDIVLPQLGKGWLYGMRGQGGCHSVGTLIKKELHDKVGWYSKLFPLCADQLFIGSAINSGARVRLCDFTAGVFSMQGLSGTQTLGLLTEKYRVQLLLGYNKYIQTLLFVARLAKNIGKI